MPSNFVDTQEEQQVGAASKGFEKTKGNEK